MTQEMVLLLLEYCVTMDKTNFSYIEKVADGWREQGINTLADATKVLNRLNKEVRMQKKCKKIFVFFCLRFVTYSKNRVFVNKHWQKLDFCIFSRRYSIFLLECFIECRVIGKAAFLTYALEAFALSDKNLGKD